MGDSNSLRIRGQETSALLRIDGVLQGGSFAKVKSFRFNPRADLVDAADLLERFEDRRIRPAVQRTFERPDGTGNRRIDIGERGGNHAGGERAGI